MWRRIWGRFGDRLRRDFMAGLLVFVPIGFTVFGVLWIVERLDKLVLPPVFAAFGLDASHFPLLGVVTSLAMILLAGALTRSFAGRAALRLWERLVGRIPIARSLYAIVKQFMQAVFGQGPAAAGFRRVVLIEYPRRGIYTYAFVTGRFDSPPGALPDGLIKVFVPSTPNPTTGYFLLLSENELIDTALTIEQAFRLIVSAGIVSAEPEPLTPQGEGPKSGPALGSVLSKDG